MKTVTHASALAALLATSIACSSTTEETSEEDILGGVTVSATALQAVGALNLKDQFFCTATLISPTLVLTAKHCAYQVDATDQKAYLMTHFGAVTFNIGNSASSPERKS
jgi:V8-like Glu-specific endopeptidase